MDSYSSKHNQLGRVGGRRNQEQSMLFPEGAPKEVRLNLPLHPSHQFVSKEECTSEQLQTVGVDIINLQYDVQRLENMLRFLVFINSKETAALNQCVVKQLTSPLKKSTRQTRLSRLEQASEIRQERIQQDARDMEAELDRVRENLNRLFLIQHAITVGSEFAQRNPETEFVVFLGVPLPTIQQVQCLPDSIAQGQAPQLAATSTTTESTQPQSKKAIFKRESNDIHSNDEFPTVYIYTMSEFFTEINKIEPKLIVLPLSNPKSEKQTNSDVLQSYLIALDNTFAPYYNVFYHFGKKSLLYEMNYLHLGWSLINEIKNLKQVVELSKKPLSRKLSTLRKVQDIIIEETQYPNERLMNDPWNSAKFIEKAIIDEGNKFFQK